MLIDRKLLEKQFTGKEIKTRKGNFGNMIDYVDIQLIIQRLNDAFDQLWSFKVIEHQILENEVIVLGELATLGISKQQFGTSSITKNAKTGASISIGDDLKAASSDSLKKCASLLGVALHIYGDSLPDQPEEKKEDKPPEEKKDETSKAKDFLTEQERKQKALKEFREGPPLFKEATEPPPPPVDKERLERMTKAYFASIPEIIKDENLRHSWQKNNIGKWSTKEWTEADFEKALDLIDILRKEQEENIIEQDEKKEVPKLDYGHRENNGGSKPTSKAQINYIQKLLTKKNYFTNEDITTWTIGKASVLIDFLNQQ